MNRIQVISPGLLTSVQDLGRPGYAHWGISASGAADALSLRAGNLLVGNGAGAAALEMTLKGGEFAFEAPVVVALTGSDFECSIPMGCAVEVKHVRCGAARSGARAYLCVRGGIEVPRWLNSASTHLLTGVGGFQGRALRRGDVLAIADAAAGGVLRGPWVNPEPYPCLRVTAAPGADQLCDAVWRVREDSDRMGLRLHGTMLEGHGHMLTEGVPLGAVQIPPGGQPMILFVEHQTTGGYPKIANVISADFHAVGQLRPRDEVRFERVSMATALKLLRAQEERLNRLGEIRT